MTTEIHFTSIIVAYDKQRHIGLNGELPWGRRGLPSDLDRFRNMTMGSTVIMGRKTFESIGMPLPNRENIVLSRSPRQFGEKIIVATTLAEALEKASFPAYVIGGSSVYEEALSMANVIYASEVCHAFHGDTTFPELDDSWEEVAREAGEDRRDLYPYDFVTYQKSA